MATGPGNGWSRSDHSQEAAMNACAHLPSLYSLLDLSPQNDITHTQSGSLQTSVNLIQIVSHEHASGICSHDANSLTIKIYHHKDYQAPNGKFM